MSLPQRPHIAIFGNIHQSSKGQYVKNILDKLMTNNFDIALEHSFNQYIQTELGISTHGINSFQQINNTYNLAISIGGDGTFLNTAAQIKNLEIPILGINTGHLGFMADVSPENIDNAIESLANQNFMVENRSVIQVSTNKQVINCYPFALNEVAILKHDNSSLIEVKTEINGSLLTNYLADGIIICTPTGSTGYSLSAGGPIMVPDAKNFCISAVAPHSLYIRPVVLRDDVTITLEVQSRSHNFMISIDGRSESFSADTKVTLCKAPYCVKIVKVFHKNFFETLKEKMMWGIDNRI